MMKLRNRVMFDVPKCKISVVLDFVLKNLKNQ